jgi:hypothetical protein
VIARILATVQWTPRMFLFVIKKVAVQLLPAPTPKTADVVGIAL